ncbi:hypothetical protein [Methanosarcina horonobensis]|uniref:hypothetical protein n=1 Tax=Methanosarcina horonobensis TaxID=418008 RepID=UPI000A5A9976|nr:hypothetical protein [Methanosarcina horonobensis]
MDNNIEKKLEDFFRKYEARFNESLVGTIDVEEAANSFTDCFIGANPFGVLCGKNDDQFRAVITQGYEFYKSIGTKSMIIDSVKVSSLDEYHSMAKVHWRSFYSKKKTEEKN